MKCVVCLTVCANYSKLRTEQWTLHWSLPHKQQNASHTQPNIIAFLRFLISRHSCSAFLYKEQKSKRIFITIPIKEKQSLQMYLWRPAWCQSWRQRDKLNRQETQQQKMYVRSPIKQIKHTSWVTNKILQLVVWSVRRIGDDSKMLRANLSISHRSWLGKIK